MCVSLSQIAFHLESCDWHTLLAQEQRDPPGDMLCAAEILVPEIRAVGGIPISQLALKDSARPAQMSPDIFAQAEQDIKPFGCQCRVSMTRCGVEVRSARTLSMGKAVMHARDHELLAIPLAQMDSQTFCVASNAPFGGDCETSKRANGIVRVVGDCTSMILHASVLGARASALAVQTVVQVAGRIGRCFDTPVALDSSNDRSHSQHMELSQEQRPQRGRSNFMYF